MPAPTLTGFDLESFSNLTFEAPDAENFPALEMGYECIRQGGTSGAILNAADEVAVDAFLNGKIGFLDMGRLCREALTQSSKAPAGTVSVASALAADRWAREFTQNQIPGAPCSNGNPVKNSNPS